MTTVSLAVAVQQIVAIVSRATVYPLGSLKNLPYLRTRIPVTTSGLMMSSGTSLATFRSIQISRIAMPHSRARRVGSSLADMSMTISAIALTAWMNRLIFSAGIARPVVRARFLAAPNPNVAINQPASLTKLQHRSIVEAWKDSSSTVIISTMAIAIAQVAKMKSCRRVIHVGLAL